MSETTDLPGPTAEHAPSGSLDAVAARAGEPQTPGSNAEDEGRALGGLNNAQFPGPGETPVAEAPALAAGSRAGELNDTPWPELAPPSPEVLEALADAEAAEARVTTAETERQRAQAAEDAATEHHHWPAVPDVPEGPYQPQHRWQPASLAERIRRLRPGGGERA